jgi:hypothetical protein
MNAKETSARDEGENDAPVKKKAPKRAAKFSISKEELEDTAKMWQDVPLQFGINRKKYTPKERAKHLKNHPEYQAYLQRRRSMIDEQELSHLRKRKKRRFWFF